MHPALVCTIVCYALNRTERSGARDELTLDQEVRVNFGSGSERVHSPWHTLRHAIIIILVMLPEVRGIICNIMACCALPLDTHNGVLCALLGAF